MEFETVNFLIDGTIFQFSPEKIDLTKCDGEYCKICRRISRMDLSIIKKLILIDGQKDIILSGIIEYQPKMLPMYASWINGGNYFFRVVIKCGIDTLEEIWRGMNRKWCNCPARLLRFDELFRVYENDREKFWWTLRQRDGTYYFPESDLKMMVFDDFGRWQKIYLFLEANGKLDAFNKILRDGKCGLSEHDRYGVEALIDSILSILLH